MEAEKKFKLDLSEYQVTVKVPETDADGNPVARYLKGSKPDHFAHARNYSEIALPLAASMAQSYNVSGVL